MQNNTKFITSYEELKKYINKPILLGYDNNDFITFGFVMILKAFEIDDNYNNFPCQINIYGNKIVRLYSLNKIDPILIYNQPLDVIARATVQKFIRTLTPIEMLEYKKIIVKASYGKIKTLLKNQSPEVHPQKESIFPQNLF